MRIRRPMSGIAARGALVGAVDGTILALAEIELTGLSPAAVQLEWADVAIALAGEAVAGAILGLVVGLLIGVIGRRLRWRSGGGAGSVRRACLIAGGAALPLAGAFLYLLSQAVGAETTEVSPWLGPLALAAAVVGGWLGWGVDWLGRRIARGSWFSSPRGTATAPTVTPAGGLAPRRLTRRAYLAMPLALGAIGVLAFVTRNVQEPGSASSRSGPGGSPRPLRSASSAGAIGVPNVILVTIDTLRADYVHCYGNATMLTPTLDRLASEGVRFSNLIVQQPNTNASHASLFTGLYPKTHGVRLHMQDRLSPRIPTMARILREHGYQTTGLYSWVSFEPAFCGLDQGFDRYQGFVTNRPIAFSDARLEYLAASYRRLSERLSVVRTSDALLHIRGDVEEDLDGRADITTEAALRWLDERKPGPFFLWLHYFDPHYPYTPPPPFDSLYYPGYSGPIKGGWETIKMMRDGDPFTDEDVKQVRALYAGEISFVDQQLGRFVEALRARNLLDTSLLVVTGDHGESLADDGYWLHPANLLDTETRPPLIMRFPSRLPTGMVVRGPVQEIDLLPTVLDLVGIEPFQPIEGTSLMPLIHSSQPVSGRIAYSALPPDSTDESLMQTLDWTFIWNRTDGTELLFDMRNDPGQTNNIAEANSMVVGQMREQLLAWVSAKSALALR
jgi:arylsulfatase